MRACACGKTWLTVLAGLGEVHVGGKRRVILCGERGVGEGGGRRVGGVVVREEVEDGEGGCHGVVWEVGERRKWRRRPKSGI